jgi:thioredoxin 1
MCTCADRPQSDAQSVGLNSERLIDAITLKSAQRGGTRRMDTGCLRCKRNEDEDEQNYDVPTNGHDDPPLVGNLPLDLQVRGAHFFREGRNIRRARKDVTWHLRKSGWLEATQRHGTPAGMVTIRQMKRLLLTALLATAVLAEPASLRFEVAGMSCGDCAKNATNALKRIHGVRSVHVDFDSKQAELGASRLVGRDEIRKALAPIGMEPRFPGDPLPAPLTDSERANLDIKVASRGEAFEIAKQLARGKVTIFDFWAEWCGPCHLVTPKLEHLVKDDAGVALRTIDITKWESPAGKQATKEFRLPALPYVRVYAADGHFVGDVVGNDIDRVRALIAKARR